MPELKQVVQLKHSDIPTIRELLLEEQGGKCFICGEDPVRPCLDHSHTKKNGGTGLVRGTLCSNCNVFLAKSENNATRYGIKQSNLPDILRSMALYLEKPHTNYKHPTEAPKPKILMRSSYQELKKYCFNTGITIPKYYEVKGKPKQKLNQKLTTLFLKANIKPKFYAR